MYKCRCCGYVFEEPHVYYEAHGFTGGPFEEWIVCPNCYDTDFDLDYKVEEEEAEEVDE